MVLHTLALESPIPPFDSIGHPVMRWYAKYSVAFRDSFDAIDPQAFYNARCKMHLPDRSITEGTATLWPFFKSIYGPFEKVTREMLTLTLVSNDEKETHNLHIELITTLHPGKGRPPVPLAQAFCYVIGKADEGKGTDGFQFHGLRCYYDRSLLQKTIESLKQ